MYKEYEELDQGLKDSLRDLAGEDGFNLHPSTLYKNIANSSGTDKKLSEIFEVPEYIVQQIKEQTC